MNTQSAGRGATPSLGTLLGVVVLWALGVLGGSVPVWGQVELTEIPLSPRLIEPGLPADFTEVFRFRITDVDPRADDDGDVEILCFLVQNLGSADETEIVEVAIYDLQGNPVFNSPVLTAAPADVTDSDCPLGAPAVSPVTFEAFLKPLSGSERIPDDDEAVYRVMVRTAPTGVLQAKAQEKNVLLRVTLRVEEELGQPPTFTPFEVSITDSTPDTIFNGGINDLRPLSFAPFPIPIPEVGVVSRFRLCDRDSNSYPLKLEELFIGQGPLGSALLADFNAFELWQISGLGSPLKWGEITSGDLAWKASDFNRGGMGIPLPVTTPGVAIPDEGCLDFEIRARTSPGAMVGRTVHLWVQFATVREPPAAPTPIDPSVAPLLQTAETVMLGSGVLRIPDVLLVGSTVPLEVVGFPPEGLGRVDVQTRSVQFDPNVIRIEGVEPVAPYEVENLSVDPRRGTLRFSLVLPAGETPATGVPLPQEVARLRITPLGQPGERSPLIFQVDRVEDAQGNDLTPQVWVVSGSVTLLSPGDVDLQDGRPTLRDALLLAQALLGCLDDPPAVVGLNEEQKRIADVADPKAPPGAVPDCTTLTSADVAEIAKRALLQGGRLSPYEATSEFGVQDAPPRPLLRCDGRGALCRLQIKSVQGYEIRSVKVTLYDSAGRRLGSAEGERRGREPNLDLRWRVWGAAPRSSVPSVAPLPLANGVYLALVELQGGDGHVRRIVSKVLLLR